MTELLTLWLPILGSTVAVFVWGTLSWMALQLHKNDIKSLSREQEDAISAVIQQHEIKPNQYMFPMVEDQKDFKSEAFLERFKVGPWGSLRVQGGPPNFAKNLGLTTLFYLLVSVLVGYISSESRAPGADFGSVLQIAATVAFMAYALGGIPNAIFFAKVKSAWIADLIDSAVQALLTGLIFAALWPGATP